MLIARYIKTLVSWKRKPRDAPIQQGAFHVHNLVHELLDAKLFLVTSDSVSTHVPCLNVGQDSTDHLQDKQMQAEKLSEASVAKYLPSSCSGKAQSTLLSTLTCRAKNLSPRQVRSCTEWLDRRPLWHAHVHASDGL